MHSTTRSVTIEGQELAYTLRESEDATQPRIDVGIHDVTVVVPTGADVDPEALLHDHGEWVLDKRAEFDRYLEDAPNRRFEAGETFPYLGEEYEVIVESRSASQIEDGAIRLAAHHVEQTSIQRALEQVYRRNARELFEDVAEAYAEKMEVEYDRLEIRNQRTKWGSCSSSGTLSLNWRLVMAPKDIAEYVVIHELAHLREPNHTDEFWHLVAEYDPEYRAHAEWLENNSAQLIFTEDDL